MIKTFQQRIHKAADQIRQAFLGLVAIGGSRSLQLKGLDHEVLQDIEIIQQVGFASWIPKDSKVVIIPLLGKTGRAIVIGSTNVSVMVEVSEGETCIYDQFGHQILLTESGVKIKGNTEIDGNLEVKGDVSADGQVSDKLGSMSDMRTAYNGHKHGSTPTPDMLME